MISIKTSFLSIYYLPMTTFVWANTFNYSFVLQIPNIIIDTITS